MRRVRGSSDAYLEILEWMDENAERKTAFVEQVFGLWNDIQTAAHHSGTAAGRRSTSQLDDLLGTANDLWVIPVGQRRHGWIVGIGTDHGFFFEQINFRNLIF